MCPKRKFIGSEEHLDWLKMQPKQVLLKTINATYIKKNGSTHPGESMVGVTYLHMRIYQKSFRIFLLKVASTLLSGSRKGAVGA